MPETTTTACGETPSVSGLHKFLPAGILALALLLTGLAVWEKASRAVLPPLYDAYEYHLKAANCWKALDSGKHVNLMNVEPVTRPPGTVLVSHPFGFDPDFRGFLFRTVFVPFAIVLLSFWFLMQSGAPTPGHRWISLVVTLGIAGLPLFHHLEASDAIPPGGKWGGKWWGLMDTFEASLTVLAAVLLVLSARRVSLPLFTAGTLVAGFTLWVKPVGMIIIPLIFWHWAAELIITHRPFRGTWRNSRALRRYALCAVLFALLVCFAAVWVSVRSKYLNAETFKYQQGAVEIQNEMMRGKRAEAVFVGLHYGVGWHWAVVLCSLLVLRLVSLVRGLARRAISSEDLRFLAAFAGFAASVCWWSGMIMPLYRYLEPFLLIFLVAMIPDVARTVAGWVRQVRMPLGFACCAPFVFILLLHTANNPSLFMQRLAGVNLSTAQYAGEVAMGKYVSGESAKAGGREMIVYCFAQSYRQGMVGNSAQAHAMGEGKTPGFHLVFDLDWVRPTMIRRNEIVNADFVLFHPIVDPAQVEVIHSVKAVPDSPAEQRLFQAWLMQLGEADGIAPTGHETRELRLVRVTDRAKFDAAFAKLMAAHEWRPLFYQENSR